MKPFSSQKSRTGSHSWSAGRLITSQRCSPLRSMRTSPSAAAAVRPSEGFCALELASMAAAETTPPGTA
jgi:hypothetical protein